MAHEHNSHQFAVVLEQMGYRQIVDYDIDTLYFINESTGKEIGFEKSNHITMPYALHFCADLEGKANKTN